MSKITNRQARNYVLRKESFTTGNKTIYGKWSDNNKVYTVYSYGTHFPMYCFDKDAEMWFGNSDKYSRTTTNHQSNCHPDNVAHWLPTGQMQRVSYWGYVELVKDRMHVNG